MYATHGLFQWLKSLSFGQIQCRNEFFQSILDKMVATVRRGIICPNDGTTAIHSCATMLGLPLEKELPINTVIVTSLRKTNNLPDGRFHLVEAFKQFGNIESVAIASSNRGFGKFQIMILFLFAELFVD